MTKQQKSEPQSYYFYTMPGDTKKVQASGLAAGNIKAARDYPQNILRDRQQVEAIARATCLQCQELTNDFDALCRAFIPQFADCYEQTIAEFEKNEAAHRTMLQEVGGDWARAAQIRTAYFLDLIDQQEKAG